MCESGVVRYLDVGTSKFHHNGMYIALLSFGGDFSFCVTCFDLYRPLGEGLVFVPVPYRRYILMCIQFTGQNSLPGVNCIARDNLVFLKD